MVQGQELVLAPVQALELAQGLVPGQELVLARESERVPEAWCQR